MNSFIMSLWCACMCRFNQIKRDEDQKQQVNKLIDEIKSLANQNTSLTAQNTSLTEKIVKLTERVSSLAEKVISLFEQNSSLTQEKHQLENELAEIKAAPMPPVMLPIHGLPQVFVFVEQCRVCSLIFRDTAAAGGALPGSQKGSASASSSASTSTAKPCPNCLKTLENMEAMVASFAQRQQGGAAARGSA
jgi:regulator of replication initiation timing